MFKPATAAAVLVALSVPVYAAGDFPMAPMQTTLPREAVSPLPTGTSRMSMIPTKTRSATLSSDHER
jgi:hypothetical protein